MRKHRIERNLAFPSEEFRAKVRTAAKQRGFRTERAFLIAACEHELERGNNTEAMDDLEARVLATLANVAKEVQALFTLVHSKRHVTAVLTTRREVNFERARRLDSTVAIPRCD